MKESMIIYTDGSSRGNPGPGGWGAIVVISDEKRVIEIGDREEHTTNNRMELQGAIGALLCIRKFPGDIIIHTDSAYVISGITKWVMGWIKNGWITATKEEVQNRDLWELLTSLLYEREEHHKVNWKRIPGHSGIAGNERCDEIATSFADRKDIELYDGSLENYAHDIFAALPEDMQKEMHSDKKERAKKKAYSYVSMVNGELSIDETWEACEKRVKGKNNAKFKKAISKEDEEKIVEEFSK